MTRLLGPPSNDMARPLDAEAKALVAQGVVAFEEERFDDAIDSYRRAYELDPHPAVVFALAQAERMANHCDEAIPLYEQFLEFDLPDNAREIADEARQRCVETIGPKPPDDPPKPPPPQPPPDVATKPPRDVEPTSARFDRVALGLLIGGGVGFVAGGATLAVAGARLSQQQDTDDYQRFDALDRQIRSLTIAGAVVAGVSVPVLIVGAVRATRPQRTGKATVRVRASAGGVAVRF